MKAAEFPGAPYPASAGEGGRTPHSLAAFTMVEIALSLAIIGFALVAIIGVLPAGLSVQKDNREQTVINLDAAYLMDAIRTGARGQDDLTNYIIAITNVLTYYSYNAGVSTPVPGGTSNWFTLTDSSIQSMFSMSPYDAGNVLTNGFNIIGLLTAPKYGPGAGQPLRSYSSNSVTAAFRAINGPAMDQGRSQTSRDFSFTYLVTIEIIPASNYPFLTGTGNQLNYASPTNLTTRDPTSPPVPGQTAFESEYNLYDLRLTFRWPLLPNGTLGGGRAVYRSSLSGSLTNISLPVGPQTLSLSFLQPQTFVAK